MEWNGQMVKYDKDVFLLFFQPDQKKNMERSTKDSKTL